MNRVRPLIVVFIVCFLLPNASGESSIDFGRDIRPILSDHCFACHGPDQEERMADLRLDTADGVLYSVEPGQPEASDLFDRVCSDDDDLRMPPASFGKPLSESQIELLRRWIVEGATYQDHWAFVAPTIDEAARANRQSTTDAIDFYLDQRLARTGLEPTEPADRRTLLRRIFLDLTGLPPTLDDVRAFMADDSPAAFERVVDSLLQSPHFGEHFGRYWLDLVRYGDTHGLHLDNYREMWPYRDWVIDALNQNMPIDRFITEQLAGDLLPDATDAQKIASGFNRLNVTTNEGGSIYEEVFARNVIDRTDAFGTIFLGLTTGCAVCHDHKFDPITMHDYYALSAYFNSLDGRAMDANIKDHPPVIRVPTEQQLDEIEEYSAAIESLRQEITGPIESVDKAQLQWEQSLISGPDEQPTLVLQPSSVVSEAEVEMVIRDDFAVQLVGEASEKDVTTIIAPFQPHEAWKTLRLEALVDTSDGRVGASPNGNVVLTEIVVEMRDPIEGDDSQQWLPVPIQHAFADIEQADGPFAVSYAVDGKENDGEGWAVDGHGKTGPRTAWFVLSNLYAESENAELRVRLKYQSKFASHQFRTVRLSLSSSLPEIPDSQKITLGEMHSVGPFPLPNTELSYDQTFASQQSAFNPDEVFNYEGREYRWQHRGDLSMVAVNSLGIVPDRSSVNLLHQSIESPSAQKITLLIGTRDGHVVYLNGTQVGQSKGPQTLKPLSQQYELELKKGSNDLYIKVVNHTAPSQISFALRSPLVPIPKQLIALLGKPSSERSAVERDAIRVFYRSVYCSHPDFLVLTDMERGMTKAIEKIRQSMATTLVWKELQTPRQAHILLRGEYDSPGDPVDRATPAFLPPMDAEYSNDRLGLAQWLFSDQHPLTSRVFVNRIWQQLFGLGIVKTSEDFGSQGEPPSHPKLLDALAVDFRENGWDLKQLVKAIVISRAYQRSPLSSEPQRQIDPENRLLSRGPRYRLDAEVLRDQALKISGLLVDQRSGVPVKPPQPPGLWEAVGYTRSNTATFQPDTGDQVYRRSVYVFWKRTSPPPQLTTFDAPSRESCTARRERTNTPLQALLMMNETQYLQAAKRFARRIMAHSPPAGSSDIVADQPQQSADQQAADQQPASDSQAQADLQRLEWAFEIATSRRPQAAETKELLTLLNDLTVDYSEQPQQAEKLLGEESSAAWAAWTIVASTLLNLDEVICK